MYLRQGKGREKRKKQVKTKDMKRPIIKSFDSINRLYWRGINICKGCKRDNYASCNETHLCICNAQAQKYTKEIINN